MIEAVVTDIEGTTSSLSFVKEVLFPYARERIAEFVRTHAGNPRVSALLDDVRSESGNSDLDIDGVSATLIAWIDADRKATPLKAIQGMIWEQGFRDGHFEGQVYPDAAKVLRSWHDQGLRLYVYSSGSIHAQKLYFGHTAFGDLTTLFDGFFDTTTGAKQDPASFRSIARAIGSPPGHILFLSDVVAELDAARNAGFLTVLLVRNGTPDPLIDHRQVSDFHAIADLRALAPDR